MSHRPTDWHVLDLEKDPTPGDPQRIRKLAGTLHDFADDVAEALRGLKGIAKEDEILSWAGKTADVFAEEFEDVPKKLRKLKKSYDLAGDALASFWPDLQDAQEKADKALRDGRKARDELTTAQTALSGANDWVRTATEKVDSYDPAKNGGKDIPKPDEADVRRATRDAQHAKARQATAERNVESAKDALDAARKLAAQAKGLREDAARRTVTKLQEASDAGIPNRHWWEEIGDWVSDHWDEIVTVCKWVVAVVGIIVMIVGGPLGWLVFAAALVVMADTIRKVIKGEAGWGDLLWAALDCIPATKGITSLAKLGKLWKAGGLKALGAGAVSGIGGGLKDLANGVRDLKNVANKVRGVTDWVKGLGRRSVRDSPTGTSRTKDSVCSNGTDPIDLATGRMYLPQTDVTLPATLPLVFRRRAESGYRMGRWFGPSWSSTIDQRLEFDAEGIVFVDDEGLILAYPMCEPGEPVLPAQGPLWPLEQVDDVTYTVRDRKSGHARTFIRDGGTASLHRLEDRNGNTISFLYDENGRPESIVHSGGYRLRVSTWEERIVALHLVGATADGGDQELLRYSYSRGHLTAVINSSGRPLRFTYDAAGRVTSWSDTNDRSYAYSYDHRHRCISEGSPDGHLALSLTYDNVDEATGYRVTAATTGEGHTSRYLINDAHQVVVEIDPLGNTTRYERDRRNRLLSRTDPLGHKTCFAYDVDGNLSSITQPDGHQVTAVYDGLGQPVQVTNPDGGTWHQMYDDRGNRTTVVTPGGGTSHFHYDDRGALVSVTNALGHTTTIQPNAAGLPVVVTNPLGHRTRYERDMFGRTTRITDPLGATTRLAWSVEGQLVGRTDADGSEESWVYDGEGNCTRYTGATGAVTTFEYTHFDQLAARTGPDGARYEFTHDTELRLVSVTNPQGLTWRYRYDAAGRLTSETDFDDRTQTYTYDAAGRLTSRTNALGQSVRYERNALGQMVSKDADGRVTTYEYAPSGQLVHAAGPETSVSVSLDENGLRRSETVNGRTMTYAYDELGRRSRRTTPTGATSTWCYDAAGQLANRLAAGHPLVYERDDTGREIVRRVAGTLTLENTFDAMGRLARQDVLGPNSVAIQTREYAYRRDGLLTAVTDPYGDTRRFTLDAVGRVTAVRARGWTENYAYDESGNQTEASWPVSHAGHEATGDRVYQGTRISRAGRVQYRHDDQGRVIERRKRHLSGKSASWKYTWDAEDRLTEVTLPDGTRWCYQYDPLGRRTAKRQLAIDGRSVMEEVLFTWDGHTLCEQTSAAATRAHSVSITWDYDGRRPITQAERILATGSDTPQEVVDERFFAIVTDLVGTPTELIDQKGEIAWRTRTTLWGATTWNRDATAYTPLRFPGQYYDQESGLHHNYFRNYDPETARYLTPDPLGLAPSPNPVTYVHNPHTWIDPLGLTPGCGEPVGRTLDEAKAKALKDAGIPEGAEPLEVNTHVPATTPEWQGSKQLMTDDYKPITYREEVYEHPNGQDLVVFQDHWFGHQKPGEPGYQGPHVHVRPFDDTRNGQIPGCEEHYYYDL
ncbi:RHS repeat-associated core domain-containing protein [Streptomyces rochei]|uniref:RHS repeat-associated core domain-containing protein n=1 Tax=Streptomyces rochei TaxID=1928 RepID=A0ABW7E163_STRRO